MSGRMARELNGINELSEGVQARSWEGGQRANAFRVKGEGIFREACVYCISEDGKKTVP